MGVKLDLIALGYGLDDRGSRVRFLAGAGSFSLYQNQGLFPWG
jgi:hypothetical protein